MKGINMVMTRRVVLTGAAAVFADRSYAAPDRSRAKARFDAEFNSISRGIQTSDSKDVATANAIVESDYLPRHDPYAIMAKLADLGTVDRMRFQSTTGQPFNRRWPDKANPLLVRFFHDLGYSHPLYPGDCTPWCAAVAAWCLQRAGYAIPPNPVSSRSFRNFGTRVTMPRPGDLCVFGDVGDTEHGHVGFFQAFRDSKDDVLRVLGGNQNGIAATTCGVDFPQSEVGSSNIPTNVRRDRRIGYHYLIGFMRPSLA